MPSGLSVLACFWAVVQVGQDLQGKGAPVSARIQPNSAHLGSLPNQDLALANQFLPPTKLGFTVGVGQELTQTTFAEGANSQSSMQVQHIPLDFLWQLQEVHDLGHASARNAFPGRDFRFGDVGGVLDFLEPRASLMVWVQAGLSLLRAMRQC